MGEWRPLRIAMISYYLPSDSKIGVGFQAHGMANALVQRGHDVVMFSPCAPVDGRHYDHQQIPLRGSLRTFRWAWRVRDLDLSSFDVLHAHGDDYLRFGRPTPAHVRTLHGSCLDEALHITGAKERLRMLALGLTEVFAPLVADATVCVSNATRRWYPWLHRVIPNGVDVDRFHPGGIREPVPAILFVGTYGQRKRGHILAEAFQREILPRHPNAQLWMVCSDAPNQPGVSVLGRLSDDELADRYRRSWVFCLPSTYEGFGVPYVEAMASGTPVVATPNAGAREVLAEGKYGLLADDGKLAEAILSVIEKEPLALELSQTGLARSAEYTWPSVVDRYEQVYFELLAASRG
jgi:glycosyltransferase involved in cell wall biosynthesis